MDDRGFITVDGTWEQVSDAIPDLIAILDTNNRVVHANKAMAEKLGCDRKELIGRKCCEIMHGTQGLFPSCPYSDLLRDGIGHVAEIHDDRLGSSYLVTVSPIRRPDGTLYGCVHVARDISRQKRSEETATQAVLHRDQFLAILSHELRNPLGAILSAAHVLKRSADSNPSASAALAVIERQGQQMAYLLNDLLDVSRVMLGKVEFHRQKVDVGAIAQEAVKVVDPLAGSRMQKIAVDIQNVPLQVNGDAARLQQIQVNLLSNAVKYTPQGGRIWLTVCRAGNEIVIEVRDTGVGISPDMLEKVFEPFVQGSGTIHHQEGGLGVGLALVQMLVEMHGGSVTASSDGPGRGSQFTVRLPAALGSSVTADTKVPVPPSKHARTVLIVEDNPDSRAMLAMLMQLDGHEVCVADNGHAGLEAANRKDFDVAIIDIGLPGMDGYELARRIRASRPDRCPYLVALTGYGQLSDHVAAMDAGFNKHLVKPYDPDALSRILEAPEWTEASTN